MTESAAVQMAGYLYGELMIRFEGAEPIGLGTLRLPIAVTRVESPTKGTLAFGVGVNLDRVRATIAEVFRQAEKNDYTEDLT